MSLPESWPETTVGKVIVDLQPGFAQRPGEDDEGMTPQIRTHNINPVGKITLAGIKHVSANAKELQRYKLVAGDVVFNNTNSEEWVGKTAVFDQEGEYVFSNHMTRLRADTRLINPDYLAKYLQMLWSMGYSKTRAKRWVSQAGIEGAALASFKLPLPTLLEQQRIVDVLRQAESLVVWQKTRTGQLDLMIKAYLDRLVLGVDESEWVRLGTLVETRYGTSVSAEEGIGSGTPVLRIPNVMGGEVDTADMKYVGLSSAELDRLLLTKADVLIVRSNGNPDYVGRSAPITEDIVKAGMVYASYLIRLRANTDQLLPEYLSSFLNSAFGRAAMRNTIRTTAGQSNLSGENLTKIRIPLPDISEQKKFATFWHEVRSLRQLISQSELIAKRLQSELAVFALSGELTEKWREVHQKEIDAAIVERDQILRERGAKVSIRTEVYAPPERSINFSRPMRKWLINELSEFQYEIWNMLRYEWRGSVIVDAPEVFDDFCTNPQTAWRIEHFEVSNKRIRQTLEQLAALGLIAKVSVPKSNTVTKKTEYLTAFRPLREDENTRMVDAEKLKRELENDESASSSYSGPSNPNGQMGELGK